MREDVEVKIHIWTPLLQTKADNAIFFNPDGAKTQSYMKTVQPKLTSIKNRTPQQHLSGNISTRIKMSYCFKDPLQ